MTYKDALMKIVRSDDVAQVIEDACPADMPDCNCPKYPDNGQEISCIECWDREMPFELYSRKPYYTKSLWVSEKDRDVHYCPFCGFGIGHVDVMGIGYDRANLERRLTWEGFEDQFMRYCPRCGKKMLEGCDYDNV